MSFDFEFGRPITDFTVTIRRGKQIIYTKTIQDSVRAHIDWPTRHAFVRLKDDDKLEFTNMWVRDCDGAKRQIDDLAFTITDAHPPYKVGPIRLDTVFNPVTEKFDVIETELPSLGEAEE